MVVPISGRGVPELPSVWLLAPDETSPDYLRTYRAISLAIQSCLRERVPPIFLADARAFQHPSLVYSILVYAASRPFRASRFGELTYDPIDTSWLTRFLQASKRRLSPRLRQVYDRLDRDRAGALSRPYGPRRAAKAIKAVQKFQRSRLLLQRLVAGEAALVADLVHIGGMAGLTTRERQRREARFFLEFSSHLKRMGTRCDLTPLAPVLLTAATQALAQTLKVELAAA